MFINIPLNAFVFFIISVFCVSHQLDLRATERTRRKVVVILKCNRKYRVELQNTLNRCTKTTPRCAISRYNQVIENDFEMALHSSRNITSSRV